MPMPGQMMMPPPSGQGQMPGAQAGNMLSMLPEKMVKKVLDGVAGNITDSLSNHAVQAVQQGVPWGHIIDELLKASPKGAGMSMMGGGQQPPGGPGGGGPPQPPNGPGNGVKQDVQAPPQATNDINAAFVGQTQQQYGGFDPASLNQPAGQNGYQPGLGSNPLMSLIKGLYPIAALPEVAAQQGTMMKNQMAKQYGETPEGKLRSKVAEAEVVPPTQAEKLSASNTMFERQVQAMNDQLAKMNEDEKSMQEEMKTYSGTRGALNKFKGGPSKEMDATQNKIKTLRKKRAEVHQKLADLYSSGGSGTPTQGDAPKGATGWDSTKKQWVY